MKAQLAIVEAKIIEVIETGEEYGITGSHSVTNQELDALNKQASILRKRIYRYLGYTGRITPDFSGGNY